MPLDQAPLEFWQFAFPIPFRSAIEYFSKNQDLDPFLVAALIRQESDFNIKEVSDAHAYGLMQTASRNGANAGPAFLDSPREHV